MSITVKKPRWGSLTGRGAEALMASLVLVRSTSFVVSKVALRELAPFNLLGVRFLLAFLLLLPFSWKRLRGVSGATLLRGLAIGAAFTAVMGAEVLGLRTADASTAAFLENTAIIFVPLFEAILRRALPRLSTVISTALAMAGVALLTLRGGAFSPSSGELLCLIAAVFYACAIILTDRLSHRDEPLTLGVLQVGSMGAFSLLLSFAFEVPSLPALPATWGAVLFQAIVCTCFGFTLQPLAQSRITAQRAGLFCALGPVGGALSGWLFLGEQLSLTALLGMGLILLGMFLPRGRA